MSKPSILDMYIIIWEYHVQPGRQTEFERAYSSTGTWAELFKRDTAYLGTELLRSEERPEIYITIDKWDSQAAYERFLQTWRREYDALNEQCNTLANHEHRIGSFRQILS